MEIHPLYLQVVYLSLALQGDTCAKNNIDVNHIVAVATGKSDEELITKYNAGDMPAIDFTGDQLNVIEADLNKHHNSVKVQHAMKILRGLNNPSPEVIQSTTVSDKNTQNIHKTHSCRICIILLI